MNVLCLLMLSGGDLASFEDSYFVHDKSSVKACIEMSMCFMVDLHQLVCSALP